MTNHFWAKVDIRGPSDCWLWKPGASMKSGHGRYLPLGKRSKVMAHRFAFEERSGKIPDGLLVRHSCDVPLCCNPEHLSVGTSADNSRDMVERGRHKATFGMAKLKIDDVRDIRRLAKRMPGTVLADRYGVSKSTISEIVSGRTWREDGRR